MIKLIIIIIIKLKFHKPQISRSETVISVPHPVARRELQTFDWVASWSESCLHDNMCTFATHPYVHTVHADIARATSIHTYGIHGLFVLGVLANLCEPCLCACLWRKLFVCLFIDASIYFFFLLWMKQDVGGIQFSSFGLLLNMICCLSLLNSVP